MRSGIFTLTLIALAWAGLAEAKPPQRAITATPGIDIGAQHKAKRATLRAKKPDLVIQHYFKKSYDIAGVPGTGFCALLGNQSILRIVVRNVGDAASTPATMELTYLHPFTVELDTIPVLQPGQKRTFDYIVPDNAWVAHQSGNGHSVPFKAFADHNDALDEKRENNNQAKTYCIGSPTNP